MIEPGTVTMQPDYDVGGVALEIVDSNGHGFATVFDQPAALDLVLKVVGAVARLRGYRRTP